jgi:hypothetical protein
MEFLKIMTRLFVKENVGTGKGLLVDEAHKVCRCVPPMPTSNSSLIGRARISGKPPPFEELPLTK